MAKWKRCKGSIIQIVGFFASLFLAQIVLNLLFGWGGKFPGWGEMPWWQHVAKLFLGILAWNIVETYRARKDNEKEKNEIYDQYKEAFDEFESKTKDAE